MYTCSTDVVTTQKPIAYHGLDNFTQAQIRQLTEIPQLIGCWENPRLQALADNEELSLAVRMSVCGRFCYKNSCVLGHVIIEPHFCENRNCPACSWVIYEKNMERYKKMANWLDSGFYEIRVPWVFLGHVLKVIRKYRARRKPIPVLTCLSGKGNWQFSDDAQAAKFGSVKHLTARLMVFCGWLPRELESRSWIKSVYHKKADLFKVLHRTLKPEVPTDPQEFLVMCKIPRALLFEGMSQENRRKVFRPEGESKTENFDEDGAPKSKNHECCPICGGPFVEKTIIERFVTNLSEEAWERICRDEGPPGG